MTQVGSGRYAAPEIQEDEFCQEYDLKVDVYSLGITFCTLAFFQMDFPNQEQMQKYNYSKELFNIISYMIIQDPSQRPSSLQIYNLFIKLVSTPDFINWRIAGTPALCYTMNRPEPY